jgi:hypothetical protein
MLLNNNLNFIKQSNSSSEISETTHLKPKIGLKIDTGKSQTKNNNFNVYIHKY